MKLTFKPAPNYRTKQSTSGIMRDLTLCLCAVTLFAVAYYSVVFGTDYGIRVLLLMADAVITALVVDAIYFKLIKKDIKVGILSSYSWVTAMIITLISTVDVSYYGLCISTIIALVFGKLVFGGFGQNIFNPAAIGAAIIMTSFSGSKVADVATSATPTMVMKSYGWMVPSEIFTDIVGKFGGLGNMFLGLYPSTIGSTAAILILLCGVVMFLRHDIDWQAPVFYIGGVFAITALIGFMHGAGIWYPIYQILAGGVIFGGIFMLTDPVTSPVTIPARIVYALGAAMFTVIIRTKSNLADGVLYSILLMNMLTPAIDKIFDGNQIKQASQFRNKVLIAVCGIFAISLGVGTQVIGKEVTPLETNSSKPNQQSTTLAMEDYSANEASCMVESSDSEMIVYACSAKGFGLVNNMGEHYSKNEVKVTVDTSKNTVKSIELVHFGDTEEVGDIATTDTALSKYIGLTLDDSADITTQATFTSKSIASMVQVALNGGKALEKETIMSVDFSENEATCKEESNDGIKAIYACSAKGFGLVNNMGEDYSKNEVKITIELATNTVETVSLVHFGDTEEVGDIASSQKVLGAYTGKNVNDGYDIISGATFTSKSVASMVQSALSKNMLKPVVDYSENEAVCKETSSEGNSVVFACSAKGFGLVNNMGEDYSKNEMKITIDKQTKSVKLIELIHFGDTENIGDAATGKTALDAYQSVTSANEVDYVTGATFTSKSIASMVQAALDAVEN